MINFDELLPKLDIEISAFEAAHAKFQQVERDQSSLSALIDESLAAERKILADRSTDAAEVS